MRARAGALLAALLAEPSSADVVTDGSLGPAGPLAGPDYVIPAELGRQAGPNLFHSFQTFDVATGESATFTEQGAGGPIESVLARVTGGESSDVDGLLRSTIPGADLYLLNPAGLLFGPNARLDVQGSFHATSADALEFANGERFEAHPGGAVPVLAVAPPAAFGFLDAPAGIVVDHSTLRVPEGESLSLVGGDLTIRDDSSAPPATPELASAGGRIDLASLASAGSVERGRADEPPRVESTGELGTIHLQGGWVTTGGEGGGQVFIRGGALALEEASVIDSRTLGAGGDGPPPLVDVEVETLEARDDSVLGTETAGSGDAGTVRIAADELRVLDGALILADTSGSGKAGRIQLVAREGIVVAGSGTVVGARALAGTSGSTGRIEMAADRVEVADGATILIDSSTGLGDPEDGGAIRIEAREVSVTGRGDIRAINRGGGPPGRIEIVAEEDVELRDVGVINARTDSAGPAGSVSITAGGHVLLDGGSEIDAPSSPAASGDAGTIFIRAGQVELLDRSFLLAHSQGGGRAGSIQIDAGSLLLLDLGSGISAEPTSRADGEAAGDGGTIEIRGGEALEVRILAGSALGVDSRGGGNAGSIEVDARHVLLDGESYIGASSISTSGQSGHGGTIVVRAEEFELGSGSDLIVSTGGGGNAGSIEIDARRVVIADVEQTFGGLLATSDVTASGDAGTIVVRADELRLDGGRILARADVSADGRQRSSGNAGTIQIEAARVEVLSGGRIDARSRGPGAGGTISIAASESVVVSGTRGNTRSNLDATVSAGRPGRIEITAPDVTLEEGGFAQVSAKEGGEAGSLLVQGDRILIRDGGFLAATGYTLGGGDASAGFVRLEASESVRISNQGRDPLSVPDLLDDFKDVPSGVYTVAAVRGTSGGRIEISAPLVQVVDGGVVMAVSVAAAGAGDIEISAADRIEISGGALVDTSSVISGDAGTLTLEAPRVRVVGAGANGAPSRIRSATGGSGSGGNLLVEATDFELDGGALATTVFVGPFGIPGTGAGGQIQVVADRISLVNGGRIDASSVSEGPGGDVVVEAREAIRIEGEGSGVFVQAAGTGEGGELRLTAPTIEIAALGKVSSESSTEIAGIDRVFSDLVDGVFIPELEAAPGDETGVAGDVEIDAELLRLASGASVSARNAGLQDAGSIGIEADRVELAESRILTEARAGSGGNIRLQARDRIQLLRSAASASVTSGSGGNVEVEPGFVILDESQLLAQAETGTGGNIAIRTPGLIASIDSTIDASSRLGIDGTVKVDAPDVDLVGSLVPLPEAPADVAGLLHRRCAQRRGDAEAGRFLVVGRDGLPAHPSGYLPAAVPIAQHAPGPSAGRAAPGRVALAALDQRCR